MTATAAAAVCTEAVHEALKRNPVELHRLCAFVGEQRDPGFPTLLMFNCVCGSTLATPAISAPHCEYEHCDRADLRNGLCGNPAHGIDCTDCGVRFDPWDIAGGKCRECAPDNFADLVGANIKE